MRQTPTGWQLEGAAELELESEPATIHYEIACTSDFSTRAASIRGRIGGRAVALEIESIGGSWALNGKSVPGLDGCIDVDLGFTPATNLLPIRRLELAEGERASAPASWLDVARGSLEALPQWYERRSVTTYWYEAPSVGYAGLLEVDISGFVVL